MSITMTQTEKLVQEIVKFRGPFLLSVHRVEVHEIILTHFRSWQRIDNRSSRLNGETPIKKRKAKERID